MECPSGTDRKRKLKFALQPGIARQFRSANFSLPHSVLTSTVLEDWGRSDIRIHRGGVAPPFVPEGQPILAHRFIGGCPAPHEFSSRRDVRYQSTVETVGYDGMSRRDKKYGGWAVIPPINRWANMECPSGTNSHRQEHVLVPERRSTGSAVVLYPYLRIIFFDRSMEAKLSPRKLRFHASEYLFSYDNKKFTKCEALFTRS